MTKRPMEYEGAGARCIGLVRARVAGELREALVMAHPDYVETCIYDERTLRYYKTAIQWIQERPYWRCPFRREVYNRYPH